MREADIERALGARHDLFPRGDRREGAIPGGSAFERRTRILDEAPRAGLVEVLMGVDQSRDNKLPTEVDHLFSFAWRDRRRQSRNAAVRADRKIKQLRLFGAGLQDARVLQKE